jgi:hypothetical protein
MQLRENPVPREVEDSDLLAKVRKDKVIKQKVEEAICQKYRINPVRSLDMS